MHRIAGSRLRSLKVSQNVPFAPHLSAFHGFLLPQLCEGENVVFNESKKGVGVIDLVFVLFMLAALLRVLHMISV